MKFGLDIFLYFVCAAVGAWLVYLSKNGEWFRVAIYLPLAVYCYKRYLDNLGRM